MRSSVDSGVRFQISILSQATCVSLDKLFHFSVPCCPHLENDGIEKSRAATGQGQRRVRLHNPYSGFSLKVCSLGASLDSP